MAGNRFFLPVPKPMNEMSPEEIDALAAKMVKAIRGMSGAPHTVTEKLGQPEQGEPRTSEDHRGD